MNAGHCMQVILGQLNLNSRKLIPVTRCGNIKVTQVVLSFPTESHAVNLHYLNRDLLGKTGTL